MQLGAFFINTGKDDDATVGAQPGVIFIFAAASAELPVNSSALSPSPTRRQRHDGKLTAWRHLDLYDNVGEAAGVQLGFFSAPTTLADGRRAVWRDLHLRDDVLGAADVKLGAWDVIFPTTTSTYSPI